MPGMTTDPLAWRRLVLGPRPAEDRVFYTNHWFRGHNNPRYAELLPRLERLDRFLVVLPERPVLRSGGWRTYAMTRPLHLPLVLRLAARRYRSLFTTDNEQIPRFPGPVVADVDDPTFTAREVELLASPQLAAYVVTAEAAARRFESLGLEKPWHVVPQGVSLALLEPDRIARARARRREGEVVVGYMASWLLSAGDRHGDDPAYNVDHLLELWNAIHVRVPEARLWLLGSASERVRARCAGRDDVLVLGRLPRPDALAHVAAFDVALYPRRSSHVPQAAKTVEYLGAGVPVVAYDLDVVHDLRDACAGILVDEPAAFVDAVESLAGDPGRRAELAEAAKRAGAERDWDALAARYEREILDVHLPA